MWGAWEIKFRNDCEGKLEEKQLIFGREGAKGREREESWKG